MAVEWHTQRDDASLEEGGALPSFCGVGAAFDWAMV
jgi:hypothetical protein